MLNQDKTPQKDRTLAFHPESLFLIATNNVWKWWFQDCLEEEELQVSAGKDGGPEIEDILIFAADLAEHLPKKIKLLSQFKRSPELSWYEDRNLASFSAQ